MAITIRKSDLHRDREELIEFLRENLTDRSDEARFEWLYLQNPNGAARAWMAVDDATKRIVGVAGAFPRNILLNGETRRAYVLGDFCIAPEFRSLGPAVSLQRACFNELSAEGDPVCVDFPSQTMIGIYRRLGIAPVGTIVRYVKLLRVDDKVSAIFSHRAVAGAISRMGNLALRSRDLLQTTDSGLEIGPHERVFDDQFTNLTLRAVLSFQAYGLRSADYLNWRYLRNPLGKYSVITARRDRELVGYAVITACGMEWRLTDLFSPDDAAVSSLLAYVLRSARESRMKKLTALTMAAGPFSAHLRSAGFYPREGHPVILYGHSNGSTAVQPTNWFLMEGDRES
jgi:hypothetical protein